MADIVSSHSHFTDTLCGRYGVADIVCGRYRRFPCRKLITRANHFEFLDELYFLETRHWGELSTDISSPLAKSQYEELQRPETKIVKYCRKQYFRISG